MAVGKQAKFRMTGLWSLYHRHNNGQNASTFISPLSQLYVQHPYMLWPFYFCGIKRYKVAQGSSSALERGDWPASRSDRLTPRAQQPVPTVQEVGRTPGSAWMIWRFGNRNPGNLSHSLAIIPTRLFSFCG